MHYPVLALIANAETNNMKIADKIIVGLFALAVLFPPTFAPSPARAQSPASSIALPRIDGFDVEPVAQLIAGNELVFTLYGSPGGTARVRIRGATGGLLLEEVEPGVYEGTYTIKNRDRLTADSAATANLRLGNKIASAILDEPLVIAPSAGRPPVASSSTAAPRIDRLGVDPPNHLVAGADLIFTLIGSPAGEASIRIVGVKGKLVLEEVRRGVYEGTYTIKNRDRIAADATVTATLRLGNQEASAILGQPLVASSAFPSSARRAVRVCPNCGVVEAINVIEVKGDGNYLGAIIGGVAGALLGSQVGQGRGTTAAEIAGAAGGAYAGNEIQKRTAKTTRHYEVVVRLENGGSQTVSYATEPGFSVGTRVKVENGVLVLDQ